MAESYCRPRRRALMLGAVLAVLAIGGPARAEPLPEAERLAGLRYDWHRQHARREAAGWEADLISPPRPVDRSVGQTQDPSVLVNELVPILGRDYDALRDAALRMSESARARADAARREWEEVYKQKVAFHRYADQQQTAYGFDLEAGTHRSFQLTPADVGLLVCAAVVFAVARGLGARAQRVSLRRLRRAAGVALVLVLPAVSGCSPSFDPGFAVWAVREEGELTASTKEATARAEAAEAEADKKWAAAADSWAKLVAAPGTSAEKVVREGESLVWERLRSAARDARLAVRFTQEAETDQAQLAIDRAKLDELRGGARWRAIGFAAVRCGAAALLFGLAVLPYRHAVRTEAARIKADAKKCPRCFSEKLVVEKTGTISAPEGFAAEDEAATRPRYRAANRKPPQPKRKPGPATAEPTESGYVECKTCGFRFLRSYQRVRRLCFPVVGVRNSGKTHLLATAYDKVRKQVAPTAATIIAAPSLGDERFDLYIDLILNLKRDAGNTLHDVNTPPDPVMMHVRDIDPAGANTALVNLFDYSGELVNQKIDVDRLKKQAVKMDGFMLFLDPTQLDGRKGGVTLDRQLAALNEFMADMREARRVAPGDVIPVPVAVVIPKFDLLVTRNPIAGQSVQFVRKLLGDLTPAQPKRTTLDLVRERSDLVEDMLELIFRGVDVRAVVESYFGRQVLFFPVSSVSLFENELGVEDLSKRTIAPFGVAEPFLWLLHMHGYEVFAGERRE
ncbi:hypothetical protein GobsT_02170 [Gemmata obscuriglobus]|nr:hypothetical protein [Gemmata obscuriglobus]QEG25491.1 hypothetical protein GobsT_02170 [Gemmata obscuriglobus]VTR98739.1 Uncharacterized protein OS=Planctomyces maris DSM 8797 GN=PM8797T_23294 PE=4 SV=1 [Gemmata obscuriglobus UQM 2246]